MNVLSLFDGISCGQVALERTGIKVDTYYASEIEPEAIFEANRNYPNTIQLGDVNNWKSWDIDWENIGLLIGGSPCQGFSSSGLMMNFNDMRSGLFFRYVEILSFIKSKNPQIKFLLENVNMKKEWVDIISNKLGVEPVLINSKLVSAQSRPRLYWCNWDIEQPNDKHIHLKDILQDKEFCNSAAIRTRPICEEGGRKSLCLEVNESGKSLCLVTVNLNNLVSSLPKGRYKDVGSHDYPKRVYTTTEMCRLQTLPDDYILDLNISRSAKLLGNCWTVDVIAHIFNAMSATISLESESA